MKIDPDNRFMNDNELMTITHMHKHARTQIRTPRSRCKAVDTDMVADRLERPMKAPMNTQQNTEDRCRHMDTEDKGGAITRSHD